MGRLLIIVFALLSGTVVAGDIPVAGQVVLSVGSNVAQLPEAQVRQLKRKSEIYTRDQISTGANGQLQLRFTDNSRLALSPDSIFQVQEYNFSESSPADGRSVYQLIRGGLRTITGAIADADKQNYEVRTPTATIGVRGTHYSLFFCDHHCNENTQSKLGLYGYVLDGGIFIVDGLTKAPVSSGQFFFLGAEGSDLKIQNSPFQLFERLNEEGVDLMGGEFSAIPALEVNQQPLQGSSVESAEQVRPDGTVEQP